MLTMTRRQGELVTFDDLETGARITIEVRRCVRRRCTLSIDAPQRFRIERTTAAVCIGQGEYRKTWPAGSMAPNPGAPQSAKKTGPGFRACKAGEGIRTLDIHVGNVNPSAAPYDVER